MNEPLNRKPRDLLSRRGDVDKVSPGDAAVDLLKRWQLHEVGNIAAANTCSRCFAWPRRSGDLPTNLRRTIPP